MKYAYLDRACILHISKSEETAKKYSGTGKVVETEIEAAHGYPVVNDKEIIVYNEKEMKVDAINKSFLEPELYPQLVKLYTECR